MKKKQISLCHILQTVSIKVYSVNPFSRNPHSIETIKLIRTANKLTDLYTIQVPTKSYIPTDYNNMSITHRLSE